MGHLRRRRAGMRVGLHGGTAKAGVVDTEMEMEEGGSDDGGGDDDDDDV
jgi:hypothetical protein